MKWPVYDGDSTRLRSKEHRRLVWKYLTLCSFWIAWRMLHADDIAFIAVLRMQMYDGKMPTRGQYRRLEWLATYAHRTYEQPVFVGGPVQPVMNGVTARTAGQ